MFKVYSSALLSIFLLTSVFSSCKKEDLVDTSTNEITDLTSMSQFDENVASGVSMIFFHASWCTNCAAQRPAVESVSTNATNKDVFFGEVEFEEHEDIVKAKDIIGFPTIVVYKDGKETKRFIGQGHSEEALESSLDEVR